MPQQHRKGYGLDDLKRAMAAIPPAVAEEVFEDSEVIATNYTYAGRPPRTTAELHAYTAQAVTANLCYLFLGGFVEFKTPVEDEAEQQTSITGEDVEDDAPRLFVVEEN